MEDEISIDEKETEVIKKVRELAANIANVDVEEITPDTDLRKDLSLDSLDHLLLALELEKSLGITIPESEYISNPQLFPSLTVAELCALVTRWQTKQ